MKRFIYIFLFVGFIFLFITGCSDYNEINNVMIVDSIGIDKNNNTYLVSFNTYIGNNKYETYDVEAADDPVRVDPLSFTYDGAQYTLAFDRNKDGKFNLGKNEVNVNDVRK